MTRPEAPWRPRAVVFDAYGTLFDVFSVATLAEELFPGRGDALTQLWRTKQLEYSWLRAMSGRYKPFWDVTGDALEFSAEKLGLAVDAHAKGRLLDQYARLAPFPENKRVLEQLRAQGLKTAILTNGNAAMVAGSIRGAGLDGLFDQVLCSDAVNTFKTTDAIYALVPRAFDCTPSDLLLVSSNCWDAIGARWYGYRTFWVNRAGQPLERLDQSPDGQGRTLADLLAFLSLSQ